MKSILLIISLFALCSGAIAQNYQTVRSDRVYFYKEIGSASMRAIKIDSVEMSGNDTVLQLFPTIRYVSYECYDALNYPWLGKNVIIEPDGTNLFLNKYNLPITIHTQAPVGSNWVCHTESNGNYVVAHVESVEVVDFLSVTDTVKTIRFNYYSVNNQIINEGVHHKRIKLSKNYGMLQALPFYVFPNIDYPFDNYSFEPVVEYELTGIDNEIGDSNIGYKDFFDFQPEDEMHRFYEYYYRESPSIIYHRIRREIIKIIERTDFAEDSVAYVISRCGVFYNSNPSQTTIQTYNDTITRIYRFNNVAVNSRFLRLPQETYFPSSSEAAYLWMSKQFNNRLVKRFMCSMEMPYLWGDCYVYPMFDGCLTRDFYVQGLGGPYYQCTFHTMRLRNQLVYFKKGDETWGTPYVCDWLLSTEDLSDDDQQVFNVYPNPAENSTNILIPEFPAVIEIYDLNGKLMISRSANSSVNTVDISALPKGVYMLQVRWKNNPPKTLKLLKK